MSDERVIEIAVLPGDGIGHELLEACLQVLDQLQKSKESGFPIPISGLGLNSTRKRARI